MESFYKENLTPELYGEMWPLMSAHYKEIAHYQDIPLEPDIEKYISSDESGKLRVFTIRDDGGLVGYCVFFVIPNPHYKSSLIANQDILFLRKDFRGKMLGLKFLKWCDEQLKSEGVQCVYHHVKKKHDFSPILERIGYQLVDLIYTRRLD